VEAGTILFAGGDVGGALGPYHLATSVLSSTGSQIYNPSTNAFTKLTGLNTARESAASVVLPNGKTLIVGGETCIQTTFGTVTGSMCTALQTAELYTESAGGGTFTAAGGASSYLMTIARSGPTATLIEGTGNTLLDGKVLIVGGSTGESWLSVSTPNVPAPSQIALNTAEIYDPVNDSFTAIDSVPGCPTAESPYTTPACTTGLPATCPQAPTAITSATESGTTVTMITTANPPDLIVGDTVSISSLLIPPSVSPLPAGYNGTFTVTGPGSIGTVVTGTTFTYTAAVSGLGTGAGGTASAGTLQCGMVDQGAALIPNGSGKVLMAGGDLVAFLGQSSPMSFIFDPNQSAGSYWTQTAALNTPRELFALNAMDPKVVTGALSGELVAFGGVEGAAAVAGCTNGEIDVTTLNTAEVFDPAGNAGAGTWSAVASTMGAKRAGYATQFDNVTDTLAGQVILAGGVDVEAGVWPPTDLTGCVVTTAGLKQGATAETDLYNPMSGTGGTFTATSPLTQAREGQVQAELGGTGAEAGDIIAIGGACTKPTPNLSSWVIGTSAATLITACNSANAGATGYYSELYTPSSGLWTKGPLLLGTAVPTNSAASATLP
jgi:hypothetical protein